MQLKTLTNVKCQLKCERKVAVMVKFSFLFIILNLINVMKWLIIICVWLFLIIWPMSLMDSYKNRHVRNICSYWVIISITLTILFICIGIPLLYCCN
jgi:CDP-diglyceride synthetase